ncbi:antA/AntB antirepressor family protein [Riemerella anatipestifer]|uniref:antA/AntB antirepressor family protein n=1 Tax=Riemerella anatipestifer TaxID=34085 RepID=UPI0021D57857|nr:antA/AntB antirepressor family protein [Riemerella anatipestifer]MCU7559101.1 antA/AntB antirepressor family protein [Riemerella anatipestifer]MDY3400673.1 antA/AntB antirepressor family protein [Riemerella anatipestifer]
MELIKITEHNGNSAVSARELYQFLESKQQFSDWIQNRIRDYGFIEGQDFEVFHNSMKNPSGGRPTVEYAISLDMAKELSMVERTEKGKQARRYFIECERRLKEQPKLPTLPIKQQKANLLMELTELIKIYLYRGDIQMIAATYDVEPYKIRSVLKGKSYEADILKVLYEKAMQNKAVLKDGMQVMINNLKA